MAIGRAVPNVKSERPAETRDFFVAVDRHRHAAEQPNDDMAAPSISLRGEEWEVRRFMLREPSGTIVNVLSHRSGRSPGP